QRDGEGRQARRLARGLHLRAGQGERADADPPAHRPRRAEGRGARAPSPALTTLRLGLVQERGAPAPEALADGIAGAARDGAQVVCLQELTLSLYLDGAPPEPLLEGPTFAFAAAAARDSGVFVVASLYEA